MKKSLAQQVAEAKAADVTEPVESTVSQPISQPAAYVAPAKPAARVRTGYVRIFPRSFGTSASVPEAWKTDNWTSAGPWCKVEGEPVHPDFEANYNSVK